MDAAKKKRLKLEAFCRFHYGLTLDEVKRASVLELRVYNEVWLENRKFWCEFFEKLVARLNLLSYKINVKQENQRVRFADGMMYFGERPRGSKGVLDLRTKDGQDALAKYFSSLAKGKVNNGKQ